MRILLILLGFSWVGAARFELTTSCSQSKQGSLAGSDEVELAGEELARALLDAVREGEDVTSLVRSIALERLPDLRREARDVIAILTGEPTSVAAALRLAAASLSIASTKQETGS